MQRDKEIEVTLKLLDQAWRQYPSMQLLELLYRITSVKDDDWRLVKDSGLRLWLKQAIDNGILS